jgi:hypothetical protein
MTMAHAASYPTDQVSHRPGGFLCLGCVPSDESRPRHGPECIGRSCPCTCRATLGLAGPFADELTMQALADWEVA